MLFSPVCQFIEVLKSVMEKGHSRYYLMRSFDRLVKMQNVLYLKPPKSRMRFHANAVAAALNI